VSVHLILGMRDDDAPRLAARHSRLAAAHAHHRPHDGAPAGGLRQARREGHIDARILARLARLLLGDFHVVLDVALIAGGPHDAREAARCGEARAAGSRRDTPRAGCEQSQ
jgi:hypothetical protein